VRNVLHAMSRKFNAEADKLYAEAQRTRLDVITLSATFALVVLALAVVFAQIKMTFFR